MTASAQLPAPVRDTLAAGIEEAKTLQRWRYPWDGLEAALTCDLSLIGYGSLVNAGSAKRTLSSAPRAPVLAAGVRRVFDYFMDPVPERYGPLESPDERAALNVRPTYDPDDVINGVLTSVPVQELARLRDRELGYDLVQVPYTPWPAVDEPAGYAFILTAPPGVASNGERHTGPAIRPHRQYYTVCRDGAASYGQDFLDFWLDSTFLADGVTSLRAWERNAAELAEDRRAGRGRRLSAR